MARIRTIKPEFWTDDKTLIISRDARLLFIAMWNFADDEGRMEDKPVQLKARIFPMDADIGPVEVNGLLTELANVNLIQRYTVDGADLINIPNFRKHQKIDKPNPSKYPTPFDEDSTNGSRMVATPHPRKGMEKEKDIKKHKSNEREVLVDYSDEFEQFYEAYPNKKGGKDKAWGKWKQRAWNQKLPPLSYLLSAIERLKQTENWRNGFIPMITTFLNQGRWSDVDGLGKVAVADRGQTGKKGCPKCQGTGIYYDRARDAGVECDCREEK